MIGKRLTWFVVKNGNNWEKFKNFDDFKAITDTIGSN